MEASIRGRDLITGLPREIVVTDADIREAIAKSVRSLANAIKEVIEETFAQVKEDYAEDSIVRQLAEQRFSKLKGIESLKARQRVYAYLMRRGFSADIVSDVVKEL